MPDLRAARRYASALFNVALQQNQLETVEADLYSVMETWERSPQIADAMRLPQVPMETKRRIWTQLLEGKVVPLVQNFVLLLLDKRRIDLLPFVGEEFQGLADQHRNIVRASVITAVPLRADEADALKASLFQRTGKQVELTQMVDPTIVGGGIVRIGDQIIDGSVRGYLTNLKRQLAGSRY